MGTRASRYGLAALAMQLCCLMPCSGWSQATPQPEPERQALFGETHVHTSWSL
jgi:hypothetical protein